MWLIAARQTVALNYKYLLHLQQASAHSNMREIGTIL
jgi:hypothetical protein